MTVTVVFADSTDGYIVSQSVSSYTSARAGTGNFSVFDGSADLIIGQSLANGQYNVHESFARWAFTAPAGEVVTGAAFRFYQHVTNGLGIARDVEIRQYAYAAPLTSASWSPGANLASLPLLASVVDANGADGKFVLAGSTALMDLLAAGSSTISTVIHSSRTRTGTAPTGFEQNYWTPSEGAGTTKDAALVFTSSARSTLFGVLAGSVRLSDGSWAVLESDGGTSPVVTLRRHTGSAVTTVATLPAAFAAPRGAQGIALVVDGSDNLYVLGTSSSAGNSLAAVKYTKGSGWTWTAGSVVTSALPAYSAPINQVAAAWNGSSVFVVAGHAPGSGISGAGGNSVAYAVLSPSTLAVVASGSAPGSVLPQPSPPTTYFDAFTNETGSALDVAASSSGAASGYVVSPGKDSAMGDAMAVGVGRYELSASAITTSTQRTAGSSFARKDGSAKVRVISTGASTVAVVTADPDAGWGITVVPYQATASGWTALAQAITLDGQGITGMPAASALAGSLAWDVVYLTRDNKLWIYFPDSTDGRIVRRTGVDLTTYQATKESVTVSTVGSAGGTNLAVRVARNADVAGGALVTVAHKASGGTLSTVYVLDAYNVAPTEPTLTGRGNFDATAAAVFGWTFNDPNLPSDAQTAYQLQIVRVSDSVTVVDTGKVTSTSSTYTLAANTLTNGVAYQWRVRTYDQGDLVSPWSPYSAFSTGAGGTVTITSPAADNPAGVVTDDYDVTWTVAGTTQAQFRVWVTRDDTGATVHDSFIATGTQTTWRVTDMVSDVQHTIHVVVSNASGVGSNEATRKITPSYGTPEKPSAAVSVEPEAGYVLVTTENPAPGSAGFPTYDFESGSPLVLNGTGATVDETSTDFAHSGSRSAKVTTTAQPAFVRTKPANATPVVAGNRYTAGFWAYSAAGISNMLCAINWKPADPNGATISTSSGSGTNVPAGVWTYVSVSANAPAGAANALFGPGFTTSPAPGFVFYADQMTMALASDRPVPTINRVWRREAGTGEDYVMIGSAPVGDEYRDYGAAAGVAYEYKVEAVAP